MPEQHPHKLRLKLANGSELEAEGSAAFIAEERGQFIALQRPGRPGEASIASAGALPSQALWETILEVRGPNIQLRAKLGGDKAEKEACLILLAASKIVLRTPKPTAAQLARWLRASGYPILRVDRAIKSALERGEILASGSRRARRYELSGPGLAKAFTLASQLSAFIQPSA
ncbi:MAG: hypothetical protein ABII00_01215 [Elusimicrobiota bacterium]